MSNKLAEEVLKNHVDPPSWEYPQSVRKQDIVAAMEEYYTRRKEEDYKEIHGILDILRYVEGRIKGLSRAEIGRAIKKIENLINQDQHLLTL
jgi:hypothetical protein